MYLADVEEGGETYFPKVNLQVAPKKGDAVLFWDATPDHKDDDMSLHGSKPVISGTKWSLTRWIREKPMSRFHDKS
jgi:prolyl 4-hydroxylase